MSWEDEKQDILDRFSEELAKATGDGSKKRQAGEKPPWYEDMAHEGAIFSHLTKWKRGELVDPDSGAHPLVHLAWRALAIACRETGNTPMSHNYNLGEKDLCLESTKLMSCNPSSGTISRPSSRAKGDEWTDASGVQKLDAHIITTPSTKGLQSTTSKSFAQVATDEQSGSSLRVQPNQHWITKEECCYCETEEDPEEGCMCDCHDPGEDNAQPRATAYFYDGERL